MIANAPMAVIPITKIVSAMIMIQSVSPIEVAAKSERNWFIATVGWLIAGALVTGLLTVLLYRKTGQYQAAVKSDADARIAEAGARAARADAQAATANEGVAKSKEEIARLTLEAEKAKTERAEADKQIAIAKADALRAKEGIANAEAVSAKAAVEVARLQVVVANAEKERALAQKALLELQERVEDRHLLGAERDLFVAVATKATKGWAEIHCVSTAPESCTFADEIKDALEAAGWTAKVFSMVNIIRNPVGLHIVVQDPKSGLPAHAEGLRLAFQKAGIGWTDTPRPTMPADLVLIDVGIKP